MTGWAISFASSGFDVGVALGSVTNAKVAEIQGRAQAASPNRITSAGL
jgi:hypothetical protein